jgi:putative intracellular protease/amidase
LSSGFTPRHKRSETDLREECPLAHSQPLLTSFRSFRGKIDTLLVPGGIGVEEGKPDAAAVRWLQQAAAYSRRVGSICTGAFLLAHAGLLDGRRVATHWAFAAELARRYPKVNVDPEPISTLRTIEPPRELEAFPYFMSWHPRLTNEPAHMWLRDQVRIAARSIRDRSV